MNPPAWDTQKGRAMWIGGEKVTVIADSLGVSEKAITRARARYGWPPRKDWTPRKCKKSVVTRRCEDCKGHFLTSPGGYVHEECKMRRAA